MLISCEKKIVNLVLWSTLVSKKKKKKEMKYNKKKIYIYCQIILMWMNPGCLIINNTFM